MLKENSETMNPYETLNVKPDADTDTIRKAHRKAARASHPDHGGNTEAFLAVQKSYEILTDPERRKRYDETGKTDDNDPRKEAIARLVGFVVSLAEKGDWKHDSLLTAMRRQIAQMMQQGEQAKKKATKEGDRIRKLAERFTAKTQNILGMALEKRATEYEAQVATIEKELATGTLMLEILNEYETDEKPTSDDIWGTLLKEYQKK